MSSIFSLLQRVHKKVHDSAMKLNYSEPKIFTGGVDISAWSKLSLKEKKRQSPKNGISIIYLETRKQLK